MDLQLKDRRYDPAAMGDVLGDAGEPIGIRVGDTVWKLGYPTGRQKDRYEKYLIEYETKIVKRQKAILEPGEYSARVDQLAKQIEDRAFATGAPLWLAKSAELTGWMLWVRALFAENHPDISNEQVEQIATAAPEDLKLALKVVIPPFLLWVIAQAEAMARKVGDEKVLAQMGEMLAGVEATFRAAFPDLVTPTP